MTRAFILNMVFLTLFGCASYASENAAVDNYTKEKPSAASFIEIGSKKRLQTFSLKTEMRFKGQQVIATQEKNSVYINMNTTLTVQKGNNKYVLPYKKKLLLNRITFNPNESIR